MLIYVINTHVIIIKIMPNNSNTIIEEKNKARTFRNRAF
jgi:hypothetical protein